MIIYRSGNRLEVNPAKRTSKTPTVLYPDIARGYEFMVNYKEKTVLSALLRFPSWPERKHKTQHLSIGFVRSQGPPLRAICNPPPPHNTY